MTDSYRFSTRHRRLWLWTLSAAVVGVPLVVVMPALGALAVTILGVVTVVALVQDNRNGTTLLAVCAGLAIPAFLYFGLAITRS